MIHGLHLLAVKRAGQWPRADSLPAVVLRCGAVAAFIFAVEHEFVEVSVVVLVIYLSYPVWPYLVHIDTVRIDL